MIHVTVTDDHPAMRHWIRRILAEETDLDVIAEAANGQQLLDQARL